VKSVPLLDDTDRSALRERFGEHARFGDTPRAVHVVEDRRSGDALDPTFARPTSSPSCCGACSNAGCRCSLLRFRSNLLVGDGGIRGIVLRLEGDFTALDVRTGDGAVIVEAGRQRSLSHAVHESRDPRRYRGRRPRRDSGDRRRLDPDEPPGPTARSASSRARSRCRRRRSPSRTPSTSPGATARRRSRATRSSPRTTCASSAAIRPRSASACKRGWFDARRPSRSRSPTPVRAFATPRAITPAG